jgi:hypothetical protein
MVVNLLRVNSKNYSIIVCLSKITTIITTITTSRKLVSMGRKNCLFVYYAKLISTKLWMVEEGATLKGGLELWTMKGMIRRGIWKQM